MAFYDKNGVELAIGDHIIPDAGLELVLVSSGYLAEAGETVLFGQQVENLACFSWLTQENLSRQWTKLEV